MFAVVVTGVTGLDPQGGVARGAGRGRFQVEGFRLGQGYGGRVRLQDWVEANLDASHKSRSSR
jgi:hypothetical protein